MASHRGGPGSIPDLVNWELWWTKWRWGWFSPSTSVSPANLHSTKFSIIIITRGRYNRPFNGCHAEWTQLDSTPTMRILKKKSFLNAIEVIKKLRFCPDFRLFTVTETL
jgi:hypothetical protein